MTFDRHTTTEDVLHGIDLTGKHALVTGASTGLGEETARALASRGAAVTLAVRSLARGEEAAEKIRRATGNRAIDVGEVELSEPDSVRAFVKRWLGDHSRLDILVNNAGIMAWPETRTSQGWEMQLATNYLGHFLLTCLLAPTLRLSASSRVVSVSSAGHKFGDVDFADPNFEHRPYEKYVAYGQSKTAIVLFSVELNRRLSPQGVTANAVHPGGIQTQLGRRIPQQEIDALLKVKGADRPKLKSLQAGAATSVWAATSPDLDGKGGLYLEDCHVGALNNGGVQAGGYAAYARDPEHAARLWVLSEKLLGQWLSPPE